MLSIELFPNFPCLTWKFFGGARENFGGAIAPQKGPGYAPGLHSTSRVEVATDISNHTTI